MTKTELLLFEKMIANAVEKAVNEAMEFQKKELKDIKALTAKLIKENRELKSAPINENWISKTSSDVSSFKKITSVPQNPRSFDVPPSEIASLPASVADRLAETGDLPDVDAPIFFDSNSSVMKSFKEKFVQR